MSGNKPKYGKRKDDIDLAWTENVEYLRLQGRQILRRVLQDAEEELGRQFSEAAKRGRILRLQADPTDLEKLIAQASQKQLPAAQESEG